MKCKEIREILIPWLDGELSPDKADAVQDWFSTCQEKRQCSLCQSEIQAYQALQSALSALPKPELPAYVHYRILDKLKETETVRHQQAIRHHWQAIPVAAAVLLSLYFGSLVSLKTFNSDQSATQTTALANTAFGESDFGENTLMVSFTELEGAE